MSAPLVCLTCRERLACCRGCCDACYRRHLADVETGRATWAALEREGLALEARPRGDGWRRFALKATGQ